MVCLRSALKVRMVVVDRFDIEKVKGLMLSCFCGIIKYRFHYATHNHSIMEGHMELAERYAYTVYTEKSFTAAAKALYISQPGLSAMITKLEKKLGFVIFDRSTIPLPVVIFAHGGGFVQPNDKRQGYIPVFAKALTKEGYAVVSPDYPVFDNLKEREAWNKTAGADRAAEAVYLAYQYTSRKTPKGSI